MAEPINFDDSLDYIFIANDSGSSTYLISNDATTTNSNRMTNAINAMATTVAATAATATTTAIMLNGISSNGGDEETESTMLTALMGTAMNTATTGGNLATNVNSMTSISAAALVVAENFYNGVAVDLGSMLINESLLIELNGGTENVTNVFGEFINESDLMSMSNATSNITSSDDDLGDYIKMAATTVVLGLMILVTIIGNVFVIAAIILERNLQNVANYLVASLAVADLFVACLVMPLGAVYEISQGWILGPELCDIWTSCDVLCCTASILHLVAIAVDRYWAVTNIDYIHSRTSRRVFLMIFFVWTAAVIVSLAPQFGWKDPDYLQRIEQQKCMVSQDVSYQVFATCCTFYVPLLVILALYWKIYQTARKRIHRRRPRPYDVTANNNQPDLSAQRKRKRLRLRLGKFNTMHKKGSRLSATTGTSLGLVDGNSTNTVNTVEDTEFSSSNVDSKSRAGIEITTTNLSSNSEQIPTTSSNQITTVSHLVALANQQLNTSTKINQQKQSQQMQLQETHINNLNDNETKTTTAMSMETETATASAKATTIPKSSTTSAVKAITTPKTIMHNSNSHSNSSHSNQNRVSITLPITEVNGEITSMPATTTSTKTASINVLTNNNNPLGNTNSNGVEVLEDPQLQHQLQQVQQQQDEHQQQQQQQTDMHRSNTVGGSVGGGASTSNATTITSISALSPQTPATTPAAIGSTLGPCSVVTHLTHPISGGSTNPSNQVTPIAKPKHQQQLSSIANPMHKVTKRKETLEAKRERKAAKTLAIITGAFVVCWLPFFVMALLLPLCDGCDISDSIASLFLWLGYFNSTLNPVIYTIFSPEFRQAFKRILFGGHRPMHYRSGKI